MARVAEEQQEFWHGGDDGDDDGDDERMIDLRLKTERLH